MPFELVFSLFGVGKMPSYGQGKIGFVGGVKWRMLRKLSILLTHFGSPFFLFAESKRNLVLYKAQCGYNMVSTLSEILKSINWKVKVLVTQSCLSLCDPMDYNPPGSSMEFFRQEYWTWVVIPFSRGSSWPRGWIWVSWIAGRFLTIWACWWSEVKVAQSCPTLLTL